jgi:hypothetical protein
MNRELKFRAFANGKMRYDVTGFEHGEANEMAIVFLNGEPHKIGDDCQVMQFTGLTDKNGKEVYGGDWLKFNGGSAGRIVWQKSGWAIRGDDHGPIFLQNDWVLWAGKVIGNIHEPVNPRVGE